MSAPEPMPTPLHGYVGFDTLTKQAELKMMRRGFHFNVMLVGQTGLGKSTMVNTLFASRLVESKGRIDPSDEIRQTTSIAIDSHVVIENGVKLKLNLIDTPGYGDLINNEHCWEPIVKYIKDQYSMYLRKELTAVRDRHIPDTRVHVVLFFINPSGHSLRPMDVQVLKKLGDIANVIPVIAKADTLTLEERQVFKERVRAELQNNGIRVYPFDHEDYDEEDRALNSQVQAMLPFAVVGSTKVYDVNGMPVRGRQTRCGLVNIEDPSHCEFVQFRNFLLRTNLHDLIETTSSTYYESFRSKQLLALKESSVKQQQQQQQHQYQQ
ncbi:Component of the septin ring, required for cytokinesis [Malassezia sympodialis ATCC 42132]|uniref:Component of the septin ring, required for cytokinesis n=1 Tax=Malassezia sympodialis (strain ATCC 42132) TaxID=1230383 RepID=A0A1M8A6D3_MALS4|nr:Component of the septin ring, required for cytokinesis [Malassezia sympodialis ATCC 42132]